MNFHRSIPFRQCHGEPLIAIFPSVIFAPVFVKLFSFHSFLTLLSFSWRPFSWLLFFSLRSLSFSRSFFCLLFSSASFFWLLFSSPFSSSSLFFSWTLFSQQPSFSFWIFYRQRSIFYSFFASYRLRPRRQTPEPNYPRTVVKSQIVESSSLKNPSSKIVYDTVGMSPFKFIASAKVRWPPLTSDPRLSFVPHPWIRVKRLVIF